MSSMYSVPYQPFPTPPIAPLRPESCLLVIRQHPKEALVTAEGKEKARKPVDPPPILELQVPTHHDPHQQFLQSPYLFVSVSLINSDKDEPYEGCSAQSLTGSLVSSLHRLKDVSNKDGGFFIFGDISVKISGTFRLRFNLYEFQEAGTMVHCLGTIDSDKFHVLTNKDFKGMEESTYLSRAFSDQGVRLRLRKEPRGMMGNKRGYSSTYESSDTPLRPNMANEHSSSYDEESSPNKRFKAESDDRKDSFPETATVSMSSYQPSYVSGSSYQASVYGGHRQPSLSSSTAYNPISLQPHYTGMTTGIPSTYPTRSSIMNPGGGVYTSPAFHNTTNGTLPGSLPQSGGYGNLYPSYNQRTAPASVVDYPTFPIDGYSTDSRFPPS
jgi:hypothetical protein